MLFKVTREPIIVLTLSETNQWEITGTPRLVTGQTVPRARNVAKAKVLSPDCRRIKSVSLPLSLAKALKIKLSKENAPPPFYPPRKKRSQSELNFVVVRAPFMDPHNTTAVQKKITY